MRIGMVQRAPPRDIFGAKPPGNERITQHVTPVGVDLDPVRVVGVDHDLGRGKPDVQAKRVT